MICRGPVDQGDLEELVLPLVSGQGISAPGDGSICVTA
jgi:hypothetical protein